MFEREINKYQELNKLADKGGVVIFGGSGDQSIPLCELKQAFELDFKLYNRSLDGLSVKDAAKTYHACAASLAPKSVFLHVGLEDLAYFETEPAGFETCYRELIASIRSTSPYCDITVITFKNDENRKELAGMNKALRFIAASESCDFCDISTKRVWNPKETKEVASFLSSIGFARSLKHKRPVFDMVKILFCYEPGCIAP